MTDPTLGLGFTFRDLAAREGLIRLDHAFLDRLERDEPDLRVRLLAARADPDALPGKDESALIVDLGPHLDRFVADLFGIAAQTEALLADTRALDPVHNCKRLFVQRQAVKKYADPSAGSTAPPCAPRWRPASTSR